MARDTARPVLVTGCSSGIGHATALHLQTHGWLVYATARHVEAIADLAAAGCRVLPLDVTDDDSMTGAVRAIEQAHVLQPVAAQLVVGECGRDRPLGATVLTAMPRAPSSLAI